MVIDTLVPKESQDNLKDRTFVSDELILLEPDRYWLIQQGIVKFSAWTEEGMAIVLGYWGVGDLIGQPLSLVYPYQVQCITSVRASYIPVSQSHQIISSIQRQVRQTEELLWIQRTETIYPRLRKILLWMAGKFGREVEIGRVIKLRLTHQDLAELVGATRVTITKTINQLEREGFLSRPKRNTIIVHEIEPNVLSK